MEKLANLTAKTTLATGQNVVRTFTDTNTLRVEEEFVPWCMTAARTDGWRVATSDSGFSQWVRLTGTATWSAAWGTFVARVERCEMTTEVLETETGSTLVAGLGEDLGSGWARVDCM